MPGDEALYAISRQAPEDRMNLLGRVRELSFMAVWITAMADVGGDHAGLASALMTTAHEIGAALGVAISVAAVSYLPFQPSDRPVVLEQGLTGVERQNARPERRQRDRIQAGVPPAHWPSSHWRSSNRPPQPSPLARARSAVTSASGASATKQLDNGPRGHVLY